MRASTVAGFALLVVGLMVFGVATLPGSPTPATTEPCPPKYNVTLTQPTPGPDPLPRTVEYDTLSLDQQETFQMALLQNNSTLVDTQLFENISRVSYEGDVYVVSSETVVPESCPEYQDDGGVSWQAVTLVVSGLLFLGGFGLLGRSIWRHL